MLAKIDTAFYERMMIERSERQGPLDAEIVSGQAPTWHIVKTLPAHEHIASGHLIGRRFGVYQPLLKKDYRVPGRGTVKPHSRTVLRPMFPGYLFVFVWGLQRHARRILACPGVSGFLGDPPVTVASAEIGRIQLRETYEDLASHPPVHKGRRWRRRPKERMEPAEIVCIRPKSMWDDVEHLDDGERIALLHRALGLAS